MYTKDNIKRFLLQQCNVEEAAYVANWLDENPGALDEYMTEAEWEHFQHTDLLSPKVSDAIWQKIHAQTHTKKTIIYYVKRFAVAASVILMMAAGWYVMRKPVAPNAIALRTGVKRTPVQQLAVNEGLSRKIIYLTDGTAVQLMPGSSLAYPDTFMTDQRLVSLTGEAVFHVAKNARMPFTVNSGSISTTALGTVFRVNSHKKNNHIEVSLLEGRVVVKELRAGSLFKDVYLKPGETVTYNKAAETGSIARTLIPAKATFHAYTDPQSRHTDNNQSYAFNNEPLPKVFDRVSAIYRLSISYNKTELKDMTFTALLKKGDAPENILKSIALLNDLEIEKTNEGYSVKKK